MTNAIEFFVAGIPVPGGSKRAFALRRKDGSFVTRANGTAVVNVIDSAGRRNKDWRASVAHEARLELGEQSPFEGPLSLRITFFMPRPRSHYRTGSYSAVLRDDAPYWHTNTPDVLKLTRSTEDALTGIAWLDDKQVVLQVAGKVYGPRPGAQIVVTRSLTRSELPVTF